MPEAATPCPISAGVARTACESRSPGTSKPASPRPSRLAKIWRDADKKDTSALRADPSRRAHHPARSSANDGQGRQVRHVIATIYYRPAEARERVYIFTSSAFMKEAANSLLKVLEEPPEFASIFLLTENAGELLPTIRSRSMTFNLGALPFAELRKQAGSASSRLGCAAARVGLPP